MGSFPIKNVSKKLYDVKAPRKKKYLIENRALPAKWQTIPNFQIPVRRLADRFDRKMLQKSGTIFLAGIFILLIYAINILDFKKDATESFGSLYRNKDALKEAVFNFESAEVVQSLADANQEIKSIYSRAKNSGLLNLSQFFGLTGSQIGQIPETLENLSALSETGLAVAQDLDYLKNNGLHLLIDGGGADLTAALKRIKDNLSEIEKLNTKFKNQAPTLKGLSPELASLAAAIDKNYIPASLHLYRANDFLDSLINLLEQPDDQHILLLFQNPSEMRPAGGFIGSFGDLIINKGNLEDVKVDDIYNADRQLGIKLVPPRELQGLTKDWGARDANWFFDFPTSARQVSDLLESSDLFSQRLIHFQGVIAINTNVLGSVIEILGPIELSDYNLVLNQQNFLQEIQYEVEAGRDKKPGQNPKRILSVLTPIIFERLGQLSDQQKQALVSKFQEHISQKDIMFYFQDWKLQNFLESIGVAGEVFQLPEKYTGDYLAVVNANIAGGKTDFFVNQRIYLESRISSNGLITNRLSIQRTHSGEDEKEWWYRAANKNYLKVLTPPGTTLVSLSGNSAPKTKPNYDYAKYHYDEDLKAIENNYKFSERFNAWLGGEYGKSSFAAWFNVPAGESRELALLYRSGRKLNLKNGLEYTFVFDKQSGVNGSLEYSIEAPPGYIWQESESEIFTHKTHEVKSREIITLTLLKSS